MLFHIDGFFHPLGFDGEVPKTGEHLALFFGGAGVGRVEPVDFGCIGKPGLEVLAPEEVGIGLHKHEAPGKAEVEQAYLVAIVEDVVAIPTSWVFGVVFHLDVWGINVIHSFGLYYSCRMHPGKNFTQFRRLHGASGL